MRSGSEMMTDDPNVTESNAGLLDDATWDIAHQVSTASLTSQLLTRGFRSTFLAGLTPLRPDLRMVGYAFTLRYVPAREDRGMHVAYDNATNVQRLAVEAIGPGQVLVIDARGELSAASFGHIIATRILKRGAAGLVTDGALRDSDGFRRLGLPSYARGTHATTSSVTHHPIDMNVAIGCAGVLVEPGDLLIGDAEGVVVCPIAVAEDVVRAAFEQDRLEAFVLAKVEGGASLHGTYPADAETRREYERLSRITSHADPDEDRSAP
jgi:regulator of RNase E activity RraA